MTEAWRSVWMSGLVELIALFGEAQVERARLLKKERMRARPSWRRLRRIGDGKELAGAFAQVGLNAAISTALLAISVANPVVGVGLAVAGAAAQLTIDNLLGPGDPTSRPTARSARRPPRRPWRTWARRS